MKATGKQTPGWKALGRRLTRNNQIYDNNDDGDYDDDDDDNDNDKEDKDDDNEIDNEMTREQWGFQKAEQTTDLLRRTWNWL